MFWTYALYNKIRDKIYIGQTEHLEIRLKRHNGELLNNKRSYTSINDGEWILIHKEGFATRREAMVREKQLKTQKGREYIWNLIKKQW